MILSDALILTASQLQT